MIRLIKSLLPFSSRSSMESSLIYNTFWVYFCIWYKKVSSFLLLHAAIQLSSTNCWKDCSLLIEWSWHPCQKSVEQRCMDWFLDSQFRSIGLCVYFHASTILSWLHCFVVSFEIEKCESSYFVLFVKTVLALDGLSQFHMNFGISLPFSTKSQIGFL